MKCPICGKKKATIHLTEIVNGKMTETHICESCAKIKGSEMEQEFGLGDLLAGLSGFTPQEQPVAKKKEDIVCQHCGLQYEEFKEYGRLGCSQCYVDFQKPLGRLLKKIHGSQKHLGKSVLQKGIKNDGTVSKKNVLSNLKIQLQQAIDAEEFERAAMLRDQLRTLENKD